MRAGPVSLIEPETRSVLAVFGGALLVIAGVAAFMVASSHQPDWEFRCRAIGRSERCLHGTLYEVHSGFSHSAYDLLRVSAWALVIIGVLLVVTGLFRYWAAR
jgi:hypothetical protein